MNSLERDYYMAAIVSMFTNILERIYYIEAIATMFENRGRKNYTAFYCKVLSRTMAHLRSTR